MESRANVLDRFNIHQRTNSFLSANNLKLLDTSTNLNCNGNIFSKYFRKEGEVAPITIAHLDNLYNSTIFLSDGPFNLIDFIVDSKDSFSSETVKKWIETKLVLVADRIEEDARNSIKNNLNDFYVRQWIKRQPQGKQVDSDLLALRIMETLILLAITNYQIFQSDNDSFSSFKILEDKLIDWSEAIGLIRSLSDNQINLAADLSMEVDFNPAADTSQMSTILNLKPNEFDVYLLEKFKGGRRIREIVEIVAERCGIPVDSDFEGDERNKRENTSIVLPDAKINPTKHWRRVKPATLPLKRVTSSKVLRPSSLSVCEVKTKRFLSSSSTRQVDLTIKPAIEANSAVNEHGLRRHSEASAPQIIQQTTPTKSKKPPISSITSSSNPNTSLSDSFVILETPPRALPSSAANKQIPLNDLTGSVRRLFPQQQKMEE